VTTELPVRARPSRWLLALGVLLVAANLRPAITSVPPILEVIRADLALSYAGVSLLTTIPVFCMGLFALVTPMVSQRVGRGRAIFWAVGLTCLATAARIGGMNSAVLFLSTVFLGVGIAISQTLLPSIVAEYFPDRVGRMTGLYAVSLTVGATLGSGISVPLTAVLGSWPVSLSLWALISLLAMAVWLPVLQTDCPSGSPASRTDGGSPRRLPVTSRLAWLLTLSLAGTSTIFYAVLTWLAPRYIALGWSDGAAGTLLTWFVLVQILGMLVVSVAGDRFPDRRPALVCMAGLTFIGCLGVALWPTVSPFLWVMLFGIGVGGLFPLVLLLPVDFTSDPAATDQLSSMVMAGGYMLSAVGPLAIGGLRDLGGSYAVAFGAVAAICLAMLAMIVQLRPGQHVE